MLEQDLSCLRAIVGSRLIFIVTHASYSHRTGLLCLVFVPIPIYFFLKLLQNFMKNISRYTGCSLEYRPHEAKKKKKTTHPSVRSEKHCSLWPFHKLPNIFRSSNFYVQFVLSGPHVVKYSFHRFSLLTKHS